MGLVAPQDLPGPGLEPVFPALAGAFLTTAPPGKPRFVPFYYGVVVHGMAVPKLGSPLPDFGGGKPVPCRLSCFLCPHPGLTSHQDPVLPPVFSLCLALPASSPLRACPFPRFGN